MPLSFLTGILVSLATGGRAADELARFDERERRMMIGDPAA